MLVVSGDRDPHPDTKVIWYFQVYSTFFQAEWEPGHTISSFLKNWGPVYPGLHDLHPTNPTTTEID